MKRIEGLAHTATWIKSEIIMLERSQSYIVWFRLNEISGIGKSIEIKSRMVVDRSWEDGGLGVTDC